MEGNRTKTASDIIKAGRAAPSTTAWRASCFGHEDSDDEYDEIWSELVRDNDYECPYDLLTMEEALRQFDESKKARLTSGNHASPAPPDRLQRDAIQEALMWNTEAAERSPVCNVRCGEAVVQRAWVKYDVEMNVQRNHIIWPERGLVESAVVRLNREAAAADLEQMSVERTTLSSERCSFTLEVRM